jgi:hypothetical protein
MDHNPMRFGDPYGTEITVSDKHGATFTARAQRGLERMAQTDEGRRILKDLEGHDVVIGAPGDWSKHSSGNRHLRGEDGKSYVEFDNDNCWSDKDVTKKTERPPWIGLGHEMQHAVDYAKGKAHDPPSRNALGGNETRAVGAEQRMRAQGGVPARAVYGKFDVSKIG